MTKMTTLQRFKAAFVEGREFRFRNFHWGQKPKNILTRRVVRVQATQVQLTSWQDGKQEQVSYLRWPKASEVVEHKENVFFVLNDIMGDVLVYDFS
jgi:hypothetical protein